MSAIRGKVIITLILSINLFFCETIVRAELANSPYRILQLKPSAEQHRCPVVTAVCIQPGGQLLATSGDDHRVCIWDLSTGKLLRELTGHTDWVHTAVFSPDGRWLATAGADGNILFCDCGDRELVHTWKQETFVRQEAAISRVVYSPDAKKLAVAGFNSRLNVYDVRSRRGELSLGCPCDDMRAVAVSPQGDLLAGGGRNGCIRLWSLDSGEALRDIRGHRQRIRALVFTANQNHLLSAGEGCTVRIWSVSNGQLVRNLRRHPGKILAMTTCGPRRLATAGSDNQIRIWDLESGTIVGKLTGHTGSVAALDFSQQLLLSGSYDTTACVWNLTRIEKSAGLDRTERERRH